MSQSTPARIEMRGISARVTDVCSGAPAPGIPVRLERHGAGAWHPCGIAITGEGGRVHLGGEDEDEALEKGDYRLTFEVAAFFKAHQTKTILPFVQATFSVAEIKHYHLALALGPFGYSIFVES